MNTERNWVIGMIIGAVCYGILIILSLSCLKALHPLPKEGMFWNQRRVLMLHVVLLLICNTGLQLKNYKQILVAIFDTSPEDLRYFYLDWWNILVVIVLGLTDGLLVWRCYMVQKVLLQGRAAGWNHLCWLFPMALWLASIGKCDPVIILSTA
jgi:hypothetical protein